MESKYKLILEWDDLLQIRVSAHAVPPALARIACQVIADRMLVESIGEAVVRHQASSVVLARTLPSDGR